MLNVKCSCIGKRGNKHANKHALALLPDFHHCHKLIINSKRTFAKCYKWQVSRATWLFVFLDTLSMLNTTHNCMQLKLRKNCTCLRNEIKIRGICTNISCRSGEMVSGGPYCLVAPSGNISHCLPQLKKLMLEAICLPAIKWITHGCI